MKKYSLLLWLLLGSYMTSAQQKQVLPEILKSYLKNPSKSELVDFSFAGYHVGATLPDRKNTKNLPSFKVTDFGALPDDGIDDIDAIQRAVDSAGKSGGGIVVFPQGVFDFDVNTTHRFVSIPYSNVIVRGYGDGVDGTTLYDHSGSTYHDFSKKWLAGMFPSFFVLGGNAADTSVSKVTDYAESSRTYVQSAKKGDTLLIIKNAGKITAGKTYLLVQEDTDSSLVEKIAFPLKRKDISEGHLPKQNRIYNYATQTMVKILKIDQNKVYIDAPLLYDIEEKYQASLFEISDIVEESGIENFHLKTDWNEEFYHHKNPTHDNGWDAIKFRSVADCWVRNITFENVSTAIALSNTKNCVFYDCRITGNPGHNGFVLAGASTRNLFFRLQGGEQMHTYSLNGFVAGNVFTSCYMGEAASIDSHGSLGMNNLFDNIRGGVMRNGGGNSVTSPLHGRGMVLWNWGMGMINPYNHRIVDDICKIEQYPGLIAVGIFSLYDRPIYFKGQNQTQIDTNYRTDWANISHFKEKISVHSLYEFQRKQRYGTGIAIEQR